MVFTAPKQELRRPGGSPLTPQGWLVPRHPTGQDPPRLNPVPQRQLPDAVEQLPSHLLEAEALLLSGNRFSAARPTRSWCGR